MAFGPVTSETNGAEQGVIVRGGLGVTLVRELLISPLRPVTLRVCDDVGTRACAGNPGAVVPNSGELSPSRHGPSAGAIDRCCAERSLVLRSMATGLHFRRIERVAIHVPQLGSVGLVENPAWRAIASRGASVCADFVPVGCR